jgi:hypothetical protein
MHDRFLTKIFPAMMLVIFLQAGLSAQPPDPVGGPEHPICRPVGSRIMGQLYLPPQLNAQGSPFLYDEWMAGTIVFNGLDTTEVSAMNYNAYFDELVYLNKVLNKYIVIDHRSIQAFTLFPGQGRPAMTFRHRNQQQHNRGKYMQVLVADSVSLYAVRRIEFIEDPGYPPSAHPDYFHPETDYYVAVGGIQPFRIKPSKSQLLSLFPDRKKDIKQFIGQHHLRLSNEPDLVELIRYVNEIDPDIQSIIP